MSAADRLIEQLALEAHPEGGWFREVWRTPVELTPAGYPGPRSTATSITFLLRAGERSRWHRVRSDELWLWQGLGPVRLRLGGTGAAPAAGTGLVVGPDPGAGHLLQGLVPAGAWQAAEPLTDAGALVGCVVSPGFAYEDFELAE
ncbi:MAG TPA: cupin domain-containing protein [Mycobacteriales bacterium]|jgi:predicted cupin superfamily sugar epimerase|nr:cupin domain-containing protein [Mycobacteriales bacterium]